VNVRLAPRANESAAINDALARALATWPAIASGDMERAMLELHTRPPKDVQ